MISVGVPIENHSKNIDFLQKIASRKFQIQISPRKNNIFGSVFFIIKVQVSTLRNCQADHQKVSGVRVSHFTFLWPPLQASLIICTFIFEVCVCFSEHCIGGEVAMPSCSNDLSNSQPQIFPSWIFPRLDLPKLLNFKNYWFSKYRYNTILVSLPNET